MASYIQGYDEERFATTVNRNFLCLICFNVLREPVLCPRNHHCFCRSCITKHLENSRRCPTCADELTVETLTEPPRMVKDYINELNIHCIYIDRGCQEILQLQHLDNHEGKYFMYAYYKVPKMARGRDYMYIYMLREGGTLYVYL
jgi:E3 ubiquitin-protein ligase NRDP1